jgi:hypothetical protein
VARARNIKPGFFKNEVLGVADPLYSLLFEGLWVLADREGRLEDRPLRIKGEVFPYRDGLDMEAMLNWLQQNGFIRRYVADGKRCILVLEFVKHQNPHKNETASELPPPEETGTAPEKIGSTRADSLSSDSLNSDSLKEPSASATPDGAADESVKVDRRIPCPYDRLLEAFHEECPTLARVMKLDDKRKKHLNARWREVDADAKFQTADDGVEIFRSIFRRVNQNDFLAGRSKDWRASFDWITESSTNFLKVCEGQYDRERTKR